MDAADIKMCDPDVESATQAALELLDRPDRPTAVFGANDVIAAGVLKAARRLRMRLPEDLAVVGFDDSTICGMLEPELTSVHINCQAMGETCMDLLKALMDREPDVPRLTVIPTELQVRSSS